MTNGNNMLAMLDSGHSDFTCDVAHDVIPSSKNDLRRGWVCLLGSDGGEVTVRKSVIVAKGTNVIRLSWLTQNYFCVSSAALFVQKTDIWPYGTAQVIGEPAIHPGRIHLEWIVILNKWWC